MFENTAQVCPINTGGAFDSDIGGAIHDGWDNTNAGTCAAYSATPSSAPSNSAAPSFVPSTSIAPSTVPSFSAAPSISSKPSSMPSISPKSSKAKAGKGSSKTGKGSKLSAFNGKGWELIYKKRGVALVSVCLPGKTTFVFVAANRKEEFFVSGEMFNAFTGLPRTYGAGEWFVGIAWINISPDSGAIEFRNLDGSVHAFIGWEGESLVGNVSPGACMLSGTFDVKD